MAVGFSTHTNGITMSTMTPIAPHSHHVRTLSSASLGGNDDDLFASIPGFHDQSAPHQFSGNDDYAASFDDDGDLASDDENDESKDSLGDLKGSSGAAKKLKRSASTAEKKATHNAVERARRESLNGRFLVLADMLPGMNHVKRASKAAIVNKSIDLIKDLQASQAKLSKENESLRNELNNMRQRLSVPNMNMFGAAAAAAAMAGFPSMPMAMAQAQQQPNGQHSAMPFAHNSAGAPGTFAAPAESAAQRPTSAASSSSTQVKAAPQQQTIAPQAPSLNGVFSGIFGDHLDAGRSDSGSPAAHQQASGLFSGSGYIDFAAAAAAAAAGFPLSAAGANPVAVKQEQVASPTHGTSPASYHSPAGTVASGSSSTHQHISGYNNIAPSPASTNQSAGLTPQNAYSPVSLPSLTNGSYAATESGASVTSSSSVPAGANPMLAAFDASSDAAHLAAQFAPKDIAKAQSELQQFIAYQQRVAALQAAAASHQQQSLASPSIANMQQQQSHTGGQASNPFAAALGFAAAFPFGSACQGQPMSMSPTAANGGMPINSQFGTNAAGMNIPAWQMMMAHQQALSAYGANAPTF